MKRANQRIGVWVDFRAVRPARCEAPSSEVTAERPCTTPRLIRPRAPASFIAPQPLSSTRR